MGIAILFNATFNTISVLSWRQFYWWRKLEYPKKNHRPAASHWQTLAHNVVSSTHRLRRIQTHNVRAANFWYCEWMRFHRNIYAAFFFSKNPHIPLYSCKYQVQQRKPFKTFLIFLGRVVKTYSHKCIANTWHKLQHIS